MMKIKFVNLDIVLLYPYIDLLKQFRPIDLNRDQILKRFDEIYSYPRHIISCGIENNPDRIYDRVIVAYTLLIESKLFHKGRPVCHLEDLIVDKDYRRKGFGSLALKNAEKIAKYYDCYKIILNCDSELNSFYNKNGYFDSGNQLRKNL